MKRLMLIFLLVIPFCRAADPDESWNQAVASKPNWQQGEELWLAGRGIKTIPENLKLPNLKTLFLNDNLIETIPKYFDLPKLKSLLLGRNYISYVDPNILEKLPNLEFLALEYNPITQKNISELKSKADQLGMKLLISSHSIDEEYPFYDRIPSARAERIKPVKRGK